MTTDPLDQVRAAYDRDPEREWRRLETRAQGRLEHLITREALRRHIPPPAACGPILDAGGGPGRYTLDLAAQGYAVTLLDLSPRLLDLARQQIAAAEPAVRDHVTAVIEGSITDLTGFADGQFAIVLCLGGVLSHLPTAEQRGRALAELRRVTRPVGLLVLTGMNRLSAFRGAVQWPYTFDRVFPQLVDGGHTALEQGAPAYLYWPEEFITEVEGSGLSIERLYGSSGLGAQLPEEHLLALMADPERWPAWREMLLRTCDHPMIVGVSNHLLAVARRQG
jgi:SAM-dependent methyltransferase